MQYVRVISPLNRKSGHSCIGCLPDFMFDPENGITFEVFQCTPLEECGGYSMIKIDDPNRILSQNIDESLQYNTDSTECYIDRISGTTLIAMVINKKCTAAKILASNQCFVTSAIVNNSEIIETTIVSRNRKSLTDSMNALKMNGVNIEKKEFGNLSCMTLLTAEQESIIRTAVDLGYFDIPRKITINELSTVTHCSKSNLNVILRKAEGKILRYYLLDSNARMTHQ